MLWIGAAALAASPALAQHAHNTPTAKGAARVKPGDRQKIANAMSAAPPEISRTATIMDWPSTPDGKPRELRKGSSEWVCFPNSPAEFGSASVDDPMCLDRQWQAWAEAWMTRKDPQVNGPGIAYMLKGDRGASNTDPFATGPTADNEWVVSPPHVMVLYHDTRMLDGFPTDPKTGGPWVMWKGTPYAHLMVPVATHRAATIPRTAAK